MTQVQEFIPHDASLHEEEPTPEPILVERPAWERTLSDLANSEVQQVRVPRSHPTTSRQEIVNSFLDVFHLIGGKARFALWANDNPTEFYKAYSKLLPRQTNTDSTHTGDVTIRHVLPRGALDQ